MSADGRRGVMPDYHRAAPNGRKV